MSQHHVTFLLVFADFIIPSNVDCLIGQGTFDYVIDAADGVSDKAAIVHQCVQTETPVVCSGGVGGLVDPSLLLTSDLATAKGATLMYIRLTRSNSSSGRSGSSNRSSNVTNHK